MLLFPPHFFYTSFYNSYTIDKKRFRFKKPLLIIPTMRQITILTQARKKNKKLIFQERQNRTHARRNNHCSSGTREGALQKIRLGFLFHLAEEFDWQKGACTMPYVTGFRIRGEEKRKAREIKGFACRGASVVSRESPVCDEISRVCRELRQKVMAFTLGTRD